ncbi:MAG: DUF4349 domain-containing protein [Coprococcus sp.]|nr:DUF4349 domain-containing protein [Coprococcus sp.]
MKKKILSLFAVGLMLLCTGCGSNKSEDVNIDQKEATYNSFESDMDVNEAVQESAGGFSNSYSDDSVELATEEATAAAAEEGSYTDGDTTGATQAKDNGMGKISKEMLVYRGELRVDTLDFNTSVSNFKALINEKGGFIESESYTDNYSGNSYYAIDEASKHNLYTATVRVPSNAYDAVMNSATNLGDVRSRNSNVSNVTQQYSTYQSQLEIYETEYSRYLKLLENATDDEYALMIENELFDIQIQIANLKSGITNIENDVAYSYINITIKEVSEYEEEPEKTDTFFDRFKNTCKDSWNGFLEAMEEFLFWIVMNIYGIIVFAVIVFIVWRLLRKIRVKKGGKRKKAEEQIVKQAVNQAVNQAEKQEVKQEVNQTEKRE